MEVLPINVPEAIAVFMGCSVLLVPVAGFTLRFALKPLVEALVQARTERVPHAQLALLERRVTLLEQDLEARELGVAAPSMPIGR